jgi:hypothetical protein
MAKIARQTMAASCQEDKANDNHWTWAFVIFIVDRLFVFSHHPQGRRRGLRPSFLLAKDAYNKEKGKGKL